MLNTLKVLWNKLFPADPADLTVLQKSLPKTKSRVRGFTIEIQREDGCALRSTQGDALVVDGYFKVIVKYDGSNPLYPNEKQDSRVVALMTNSLHDKCAGWANGLFYSPRGTKFASVVIEEEYRDGSGFVDWLGSGPPPRITPGYMLYVWVYDKHKERLFGCGIVSRPAEKKNM
ncbi:MAG: hypothetical protein M0P64_00970 [Candidatus Pacebacteria bacterium]|nr:hypothetical protein [Candidatus Paceibacterota bacterium]